MRNPLHWLVLTAALLFSPLIVALEVGPQTPMFFSETDSVRALAAPAGSLTPERALARLAEFRPVSGFAPLPGGQEFWVHGRLSSRLADDREFRAELKQWAEVDSWVRGPDGRWQPLARSGIYSGRHSRLVEMDPRTTPLSQANTHFPVFVLKAGQEVELLFRAEGNFIQSPAILIPWYSDHSRYLELRRFGLVLEGLLLGILLAAAAFGAYSALHQPRPHQPAVRGLDPRGTAVVDDPAGA